ncbi:hypothetical protein BJ741DRAFT_648660 [Chytriomyces cf. hyalinus JEL632]|nr:hypothetical protein BJ741DRAFT_648660 [Chytriomyces cf. hyalinus JEL632]
MLTIRPLLRRTSFVRCLTSFTAKKPTLESLTALETFFPSASRLYGRVHGGVVLPLGMTHDATRKVPAVVFINDPWTTDVSVDLAAHFATQGFASLIYNTEKTASPHGIDRMVSDAAGAVQAAASHKLIDANNIILCGHSEGAVLAGRISAALDRPSYFATRDANEPPATSIISTSPGSVTNSASLASLRGAILLCGFGYTAEENYQWRKNVTHNDALVRTVFSKESLTMMNKSAEANKFMREKETSIGDLPSEHEQIDFLKDLEAVRANVLIISSEGDIITDSARNTTPERARVLLPNAASIQATVVPKVDYVLRDTGLLRTLQNEDGPFSPRIVRVLDEWMKAQVGKASQ